MKKVLLDEHLPHALRSYLQPHDVFTVAYMGWQSFRNGRLMAAAESAGFAVIVTMDGGFRHQRPGTVRTLAVVLIVSPTNTLDDLLPLMPRVVTAIEEVPSGGFAEVQ